MRGSENEDALAEAVPRSSQRLELYLREMETHISVVSIALYAHAAAGPEYEYPACLQIRTNPVNSKSELLTGC